MIPFCGFWDAVVLFLYLHPFSQAAQPSLLVSMSWRRHHEWQGHPTKMLRPAFTDSQNASFCSVIHCRIFKTYEIMVSFLTSSSTHIETGFTLRGATMQQKYKISSFPATLCDRRFIHISHILRADRFREKLDPDMASNGRRKFAMKLIWYVMAALYWPLAVFLYSCKHYRTYVL